MRLEGETWCRAARWGLLLLLALPAQAEEELSPEDVLAMSIEDLLDVDVTAAVKRERKLSEIAAAVSVLAGDEVRRSGHTSLAEALRMVPGFHVAQIDANKWSVSARGFAGRFNNKLLVMIDGRSVYTPLFGGVFWDAQGVFLPDLDRIEVIRGPGATLWGANSVNGVVNVLTRSAKETQGTLVSGGGGLGESGFLGVRHGGQLGESLFYRATLQGFFRDDFADAAGADTADEWSQVRGGFRLDWEPAGRDRFTADAAVYGSKAGERLALPLLAPPFVSVVEGDEEVAGGHLLGRWRRTLDADSGLELQIYYDRTERRTPIISEERDTFDLDFNHHLRPHPRHDLIWGLGYRLTTDRIGNTFAITFTPSGRTDHLLSAFVQDEIELVADRLWLTAGTKLEHNDYSGFEWQPAARILWKPDADQSLWAAVSRAVRTPTRHSRGLRANLSVMDAGGTPLVTAFMGDAGFETEEMEGFELGYRVRPWANLSFEFAGFYDAYDNLMTTEAGVPVPEPAPPPAPPPPHLFVPVAFDNRMEGEVYGFEIAGTWQASEQWRLEGNYSLLRMALHADPGSTAADPEGIERRFPHNMAHLRALFTPNARWEFGAGIYYVDSIPDRGVGSFLRLDARVAFRPNERSRVELIFRNLLDDRHPEFTDELPYTLPTEVETAAFVRFTYRW